MRVCHAETATVVYQEILEVSMKLSGFCTLLVFACSVVEAGDVTTFAGTGQKGFSGDGGPAAKAQLSNPFAVARGPDGALYICDVDNHRVRRVAKDGTISTIAGSATKGYQGDGGPATSAQLFGPQNIALDPLEAKARMRRLRRVVRRNDVYAWAQDFLTALQQSDAARH